MAQTMRASLLAVIAGILNRQGRATAGKRFTTNRVCSLRAHWGIPRFEPSPNTTEGELVTIQQALEIPHVAPPTVHRWLNGGFIAGVSLAIATRSV